jgi:drug/metabolite transporter (DMT)-like permease
LSKDLKNAKLGIILALSAALLTAFYTPLSKTLSAYLPAILLGGIAYLGAGGGSGVIFLFRRFVFKVKGMEPLKEKKDWLYMGLVMLLDCFAVISFSFGLEGTSGQVSSLLAATELILTALIAFIFFHEKLRWPIWVGAALVSGSIICLALGGKGATSSPYRWLLILLSYLLWSIENNLTTQLSMKDPFEITFFKCMTSGLVTVIFGLCIGERSAAWGYISLDFLLGLIAVGFSIAILVVAEKNLGAGRSTAIYSSNPLIGVGLSMLIFKEAPNYTFYLALGLMGLGLIISVIEMLREDKEQKKKASVDSKD